MSGASYTFPVRVQIRLDVLAEFGMPILVTGFRI